MMFGVFFCYNQIFLFVYLVLLHKTHACTSLFAGRLATVDGSVLITHSTDLSTMDGADERVVFIAAADHAEGSRRDIYEYDEELSIL